MTTFRPPADADRCRAIVLIGGQRGRCREKRRIFAPPWGAKDLCVEHWLMAWDGALVPRVPEPKESQS